jgi:hypothetical protein
VPTPRPEDVPLFAAQAGFQADVGLIDRGLRKLREEYEPLLPGFPEAVIDAAHEKLMAVAEKARAFAEVLRKRQGGRASHLSVVGENGGAA